MPKFCDPSLTQSDLQDFLNGFGSISAADENKKPGMVVSYGRLARTTKRQKAVDATILFHTIKLELEAGFRDSIMWVFGDADVVFAPNVLDAWRMAMCDWLRVKDISTDPHTWMLIDVKGDGWNGEIWRALRRPENLDLAVTLMHSDIPPEGLICRMPVVGSMNIDDVRQTRNITGFTY